MPEDDQSVKNHREFARRRQESLAGVNLIREIGRNPRFPHEQLATNEQEANKQEALDAHLLELYDQTVSGELSPILTTRTTNSEKFKDNLKANISTKDFTPDYIKPAEQRSLAELEKAIEEASDLPDFVRQIYLEKLRVAKLNVTLQEKRGSAEFTKLQYTPKQWSRLIDVEETKRRGEVTLLAEENAKNLLEQPASEELPFKTVRELANRMNFSVNEMKDLEIADDDWDNEQIKLNAQQQKNIMQLCLDRLGITGWEIKLTNVTVTNVDSLLKQIMVPENSEQTLLSFVISAHEVATHVYRSEKGARQKISIWKHGEPGYDETEEGLATFMEYIMGEPFGHSRQRGFAARYYAIAMALKTKDNESGEKVAKYTPQEIYQQLREYQVSEKAAATIVWRIFRGTSFRQEIVDIDIAKNGENTPLQIAECFAKDYIYFDGMQSVFLWIKKILPYLSVLHSLPSADQKLGQPLEINDYYLKLLGYSYARLVKGKTPRTLSQEKEQQSDLTDYGREFLLNIYDFFCQMGKVSMDTLLNPEIRALVLPNPNDNLSIRKLFEPCK